MTNRSFPTQSDEDFLQHAGIEPQYAFVAIALRKILAGLMGLPKDELTAEFTYKKAEQLGLFLNFDVNEDIYIPLEDETSQDRGVWFISGEHLFLPPMRPERKMFSKKFICQGPANFGEWFHTFIYFWLSHASINLTV